MKRHKMQNSETTIPYWIEFILRKIGIWPGVSHISALLIIFVTFTISLTFQFWDAVLVYRNIILLMSSIASILAELNFFIKFLIMWKKHWHVVDVLSDTISDCQKVQTENEKNIFNKTLRLSQSFFLYTCVLYLGLGAFFTISAATSYNTANREFILDAAFPLIEAFKSPVFEAIFLFQFFIICVSTLGNAFIEALFIMMILHACAKIDIVREEIKRFSKIVSLHGEIAIRMSATRNLIEKYQEVVEFMYKIEFIYSYQFFLQIIVSTLDICATGFLFVTVTRGNNLEQVDVKKLIKFSLFFIAMLYMAGVYCYGGDYLRYKNELIQHEIYSCIWYKLSPTDCKSLCILMLRSQKPMILTAGKLVDLTLENYTKIIKAAFTCLSVLRAMN